MIWYFIFIAILIIGIISLIVADDEFGFAFDAGLCIAFISTIVLIVFVMCTIISHTNIPAKEAELNAERETIIYQLEHQTYLNDNNIGTRELFTNVSKFNSNILGGRQRLRNPWTSWLCSPVWDLIEPIDLNEFGGRQ